jgi:hypothetical protein
LILLTFAAEGCFCATLHNDYVLLQINFKLSPNRLLVLQLPLLDPLPVQLAQFHPRSLHGLPCFSDLDLFLLDFYLSVLANGLFELISKFSNLAGIKLILLPDSLNRMRSAASVLLHAEDPFSRLFGLFLIDLNDPLI